LGKVSRHRFTREARIHVTVTDEGPMAQAVVVISAVPLALSVRSSARGG